MAKQGVVIQDDDGNLYFIRPEVLQTAKLPRNLHKDAATAIKAGEKPRMKIIGALSLVSGDPKDPKKASELALKGAALNPKGIDLKKFKIGDKASTVMCPW
jgi:hypothetical protein